MSTTQNLTAVVNFRPQKDELQERMFNHFNLIAKPLKKEEKWVMSVDQM